MFQLIVAVISIALVAALAIASMFYGGDAFTRSSEKANVTTLVNQGQQISGAATLYKTDNAEYPADVEDLVTGGYLSVEPTPSQLAEGNTWGFSSDGTRTYAVIPFSVGSTQVGLLCADPDGEVIKQNGKCGIDTSGTFTEANDDTATHFAFPL